MSKPFFPNDKYLSNSQICSNVNTCVCQEGFGGMDCSDIVTTPFPPPHLSTKPPEVSPTPVSTSGLTPSNTYIRKRYIFHLFPPPLWP